MNRLLSLYPGDTVAILVATMVIQVAAVVALAWLLGRTWGRRNPATLYAIWLCALICVPCGAVGVWAFSHSGITLIALPVLSPEAQLDEAAAESPALPAVASNAQMSSESGEEISWAATVRRGLGRMVGSPDGLRASLVALMMVWLAGVVFCLARLAWAYRVLGQLCRELRPASPARLGNLPERVRQALGMRRFPRIMVSRRVTSPISLGVWRPTIVMPHALLRTLDERQLYDVLVHECAHFLQRDHAMGVLERVVQIVLWPHPAVYVLSSELSRAREELCDNYVLRGGNVPDYARTLLLISERAGHRSPGYSSAIGFLQGPRPLEVRVRSLLDKRRKLMTRMNRRAFAVLASLFVTTAAVVAGTRLVPAERIMPVEIETVAAAPQPRPAAPQPALATSLPLMNEGSVFAHALSVQSLGEQISPLSFSAPRPAEQPDAVVASAGDDEREPTHVAAQVRTLVPQAVQMIDRVVARRSPPPRPVVHARAVEPVGPSMVFASIAGDLQPMVRLEPESGVYWLTLRLGNEAGPRMLIEPGQTRKVVYEESLSARVALELTVEEDAAVAETVRVSYRLTVQFAPDTALCWEAIGAPVRVRQWHVLAPTLQTVPDSSDSASVELTLQRLDEAQRLLLAAVQMLGSE
jgi:beta-lactamase regulating signal transducer with metallopeptidase domain